MESTPEYFSQENLETLNALWDEIGIPQEERDDELRQMIQRIEQIRSEFVSGTIKQCQDLQKMTAEIKERHIEKLQIIGASEDEIDDVKTIDILGSIKDKYDDAHTKYQEFLETYRARINEFNYYFDQIDSHFKAIGITDKEQKGEFCEVGEEDLTILRLKRFESKAKQLHAEVDSRLSVFNDLKSQISKLSDDLCEETPSDIQELINGNVYSDSVCQKLTDYINYLSDLFDTRKKHISEMAVEIVRLWDLLDIDDRTRKEFLSSHSVFSQKNVQDCIDEADRLTEMRNERLPEIIQKMKGEISDICQDLGYSEEQKKEIFEKCDNDKLDDASVHDIEFETNTEIESNEEPEEEKQDEKQEEKQEVKQEEKQEVKQEEKQEVKQEEKQEVKQEEKQEVKQEEKQDEKQEESNIISPTEEQSKPKENQPDQIDNEDENNTSVIPTPMFEENKEETCNFIKIFNNYDAELLRLRKIHLVAHPIIDLINQRQEIIDEFNALNQKSSEPTAKGVENKEPKEQTSKQGEKSKEAEKTSKKTREAEKLERVDRYNGKTGLPTRKRVKPPNAQDKINIEKVTRRHKTVLPRVEKKLLIMLIQFREDNNEDFLWQGKPIINQLKHIHVTQSEIRAQSKSMTRKKSISRTTAASITEENDKQKTTKPQRRSVAPPKTTLNQTNAKPVRNTRKSTVPKNPNTYSDLKH